MFVSICITFNIGIVKHNNVSMQHVVSGRHSILYLAYYTQICTYICVKALQHAIAENNINRSMELNITRNQKACEMLVESMFTNTFHIT